MASKSLPSSSGDCLDIENPDQLLLYLRSKQLIGENAPVSVRILKGGVSNRTVLVIDGDRRFVVKQALSKLRTAADWFSEPHRIHTEALGLQWLKMLAPEGAITSLLYEDRSEHVIAMEAVPEPHYNWKTLLLNGELRLDHVEQFALLLSAIHKNSSARAGEIAAVFNDRSFFDTLRLEPYYKYSAQQVPQAGQFLNSLIENTWSTRVALVHGDYSPKNVLIYKGKLILLDHEVVHFGDPAFDIGFGLTHLLSKAHHLSKHRAEFLQSAQMFVERYLSDLKQAPWIGAAEARAVRHTLGCLLARVAGRSPLEYLTQSEREDQAAVVLEMMKHPPDRLPDLICEFGDNLNCRK